MCDVHLLKDKQLYVTLTKLVIWKIINALWFSLFYCNSKVFAGSWNSFVNYYISNKWNYQNI